MRPIAVASRTAPSSALQITQWTSNQSFGSRSLAHWLSRQYSLPCAGDGGAGRKRRLSNASCSGGPGFKTENDKGAGVGRASSGPSRRASAKRAPRSMRRRMTTSSNSGARHHGPNRALFPAITRGPHEEALRRVSPALAATDNVPLRGVGDQRCRGFGGDRHSGIDVEDDVDCRRHGTRFRVNVQLYTPFLVS